MEIIAWCIIANHIHLIFRSVKNQHPSQRGNAMQSRPEGDCWMVLWFFDIMEENEESKLGKERDAIAHQRGLE